MSIHLIGPVFLVGGQDYNLTYLDWPANDCNTYLIDTGDPLLLIDCGCGESLPTVYENVRAVEAEITDITHLFLTHAHVPHAGAAETVRRAGVEVLAGPAAAETLKAGGPQTAAYEYHRRFLAVQEITQLEDGQEIEMGRCKITVRHLPGHSAGSVGYELMHEGRRMLFCGDAVRSPLLDQRRARPDYDHDAYRETLLGLLEDPPDLLFPGHGPVCMSRATQWIGEEFRKLLETPG